MTANQWMQVLLYFVALLALAWPLGSYMARVYGNKPLFLGGWFGWLERLVYKICGVRPEQEMDWKGYALAMLLFNVLGGLALYAMERLQARLPLDPAGQTAVAPDLALNTAISFITNTNWQFYGGETTLSYLTQMAGLAVHNFLSAASGMATLAALVRGLARKETSKLGNFWVDMTRGTLYVLLPLSLVLAVILVRQGVPQTFRNTVNAALLQPVSYDRPVTTADGAAVAGKDGRPETAAVTVAGQPIALGPVASQEAIKMLGTNGGGYFNVNSAHPYENPTPFTDFLELLAILLIPAALCFTFGAMVGDLRQGWALLAAMFLLLAPMLYLCARQEQAGNPLLNRLAAGVHGEALNEGNMEGKEVRFGIVDSALWASVTTAASNGSVNSMHDSFTPLGGMVPMWMIMLGEVSFGGVGSGLYGMLAFAVLAVFIAGLMVGRTPEYLGKKIQAFEMKMASIMILIPPLLVLLCTAAAVAAGGPGTGNPGAHGFSEILYAFDSQSNNNGSAFAGLSGGTLYDLLGGAAMWFGRFWLAIPVLAMAGSLAKKKAVPESAGTLPTHTALFVVMLVSTVILVGALTFFPALALGPIVEHLKMNHF